MAINSMNLEIKMIGGKRKTNLIRLNRKKNQLRRKRKYRLLNKKSLNKINLSSIILMYTIKVMLIWRSISNLFLLSSDRVF